MARQRTHSVGFDPSILDVKQPKMRNDDEQKIYETEELRQTLKKFLANDDDEQYAILIEAVEVLLDDKAIRRDGRIQELAGRLGITVGHASRLFKQVVAAAKFFAISREQLAASLAKLVP